MLAGWNPFTENLEYVHIEVSSLDVFIRTLFQTVAKPARRFSSGMQIFAVH